MAKTLVTYFSASGVTAGVAKNMAEGIGADLYEIKPAVLYTKEDLNWMDKTSRSTVEMTNPDSRPELADKDAKIAEYDTVFVGFPIWWGVAPTIVNTFLESYDFAGKKVILFATSGGGKLGKTKERLAGSCAGAELVEGDVLSAAMTKEELAAWVAAL